MQFGSLLSNHSKEAAAPEPPKALVFFFGVTGTDKKKLSKQHEQAKCKNRKINKDEDIPADEYPSRRPERVNKHP